VTILNHASDGLYPELIALARVVVHAGEIQDDSLISVCSPGNRARMTGTLRRWTRLGLFVEREGVIAFIDRVTPDSRHSVIEDVAFDDDRIHDRPTT